MARKRSRSRPGRNLTKAQQQRQLRGGSSQSYTQRERTLIERAAWWQEQYSIYSQLNGAFERAVGIMTGAVLRRDGSAKSLLMVANGKTGQTYANRILSLWEQISQVSRIMSDTPEMNDLLAQGGAFVAGIVDAIQHIISGDDPMGDDLYSIIVEQWEDGPFVELLNKLATLNSGGPEPKDHLRYLIAQGLGAIQRRALENHEQWTAKWGCYKLIEQWKADRAAGQLDDDHRAALDYLISIGDKDSLVSRLKNKEFPAEFLQ
jgi:hypothetical protein